MRAMHQAIHGAHGGNPHSVQGTMKAVHHLLYAMPDKKSIILKWVKKNG